MSYYNLLTAIRDHVSRGQLDKAIAELINLTQGGDYANEALSLSRRYSESQRDNRIGVVSYNGHSLRQNKISAAVLDLVSTIESNGSGHGTNQSASNRNQSGNIRNQFNGNTFNGPVTFNSSGNE